MEFNSFIPELDNYSVNSKTYVFEDLNTCNNYLCNTTADLKVIHMNIRSINKNFSEFCVMLQNFDIRFDVIILTETWLDIDVGYDMEGYNKFIKVNKYNKCDGVLVYVNNLFRVSLMNDDINESNSLHINLTVNNIEFIITAIYRSPNFFNKNNFLFSLDNYLQKHKSYPNHILVGDINIQILDDDIDNDSNRYMDILTEYGFTKFLQETTRWCESKRSCVDHIFFKSVNNWKLDTCVYCSSITDHFTEIGIFSAPYIQPKQQSQDSSTATKTHINSDKLINSLKSESWYPLYHIEKAEEAFTYFYDRLINHIKQSSIIKNNYIPSKFRKIKPWITNGIVTSIRTRDKLAYKVKKEPTNLSLLHTYKKYRNILTAIIRVAKEKYYEEKIRIYNKDLKKIWQTINEATDTIKRNNTQINVISSHNELPITNNNEIANEFNKYFSRIGHTIVNSISSHSSEHETYDFHNSSNSSSIFLLPVTENTIISIVNELKNNVTPGIDGISTSLIKKISNFISKPLSTIFNLCITQGVFPEQLKCAIVIPLHKSGDKSDLNNYRPISLLSTLAKIFEKCIKKRLDNYLQKYMILSEFQFGFRNNVSTEDAILAVTSDITKALDEGKKCLGVFLDLKKAFDTVSHEILLKKLENIGIRGIALDLFRSYLCGRYQHTKVNNVISEKEIVNIGIPQGTVLGPVLFSIYINDLLFLDTNITKGNVYSFADDTVVIFTGCCWEHVFKKANIGLTSIKKWLDFNLLALNIDKTTFIPFSLNKTGLPTVENNYNLKIHSKNCANIYNNCNCPKLRPSTHVKYLGIFIDQNLKWNFHINYLCLKLRKTLYKFVQLRRFMPVKLLRTIFLALVQSIIQYGIIGWGGLSQSTIRPLILLHKRIIKICLRRKLDHPTHLIYKEFNVLNIKQIYMYTILNHYHKYQAKFISSDHGHNTRRYNISLPLIEPKCKTEAGLRHSSNYGPRLYNDFIKRNPKLKLLNNTLFKKQVLELFLKL